MRLLLDTHILLWVIAESRKLSRTAREFIGEPTHELAFSAASLWEIAIKASLRRDDFRVDVASVRKRLFDNGYSEIAATGAHAVALANLPLIHKDPFDRLLVAQAMAEGLTLVTGDPVVARYPGPIRLV
ncbi:MAG TPA: type II toxin-antitoxin system VapC family toxin [Roseiarcus sp.]|nr:type II toxin-antitoxin system VapC family toxin [Roseiarcus sp.]